MKKLFLTFFTTVAFLLANNSFAVSNAEQFAVDDVMLDEAFAPIEALEQIILDNPEADMSFVQQNHSSVLNAVNLLDAALSLSKPMEDRAVAGISGYIWGACLGIAGVAIVYFLLDDASQQFRKSETTHAVIGCAISSVVWTVLYFAVLSTYWL
jgi:hypothetical protein